MLAGLATGLVPDLETLTTQWVKVADVIQPNSEASATYDEYYPVYRRLYENSKKEVHELVRLSSSPPT
jgi:xylulokinase